MSKQKLIARWNTDVGKSMVREIISNLESGKSLQLVKGLEKYVGRWDLRGAQLSTLTDEKKIEADGHTLYAQGRTAPGPIITHAKGGTSYHNYGLAFDFAIMYDRDKNGTFETLSWDINYDFDKDGKKDWQEVVTAFKTLGYSWGGDWKGLQDNPHIERSFGYTWKQLFDKYNAKDFIAGTNYVRL